MIHPDDRSTLEHLIADSARMLTPFSHEWRILTASGKIKWIQCASRPELQADGSIVWDGVLSNIANRKLAEQQLQEKEQFLNSIYNGAEMIIFVVDVLDDHLFHYIGWNIAAERAAGIRSDDVIGKTPIELFGPVEGEIVQQRFVECARTGIPLYFEECVTLNGQETWWFVNFNPLTNADGRIYRVIGTTFDISEQQAALRERKRAEAQLNQRTAQLEQTLQELQHTQMQMIQAEKMSGLGQLVAGVAHEINNPVNFIFGNLSHANEYTKNILRLLESQSSRSS